MNHPIVESWIGRCKKRPLDASLTETHDRRVLAAAAELLSLDLIGKLHVPRPLASLWSDAQREGIDLSFARSRILGLDPAEAGNAADELRIAGHWLAQNRVQVVVGGSTRPTADVIRAGIKSVGLAPGIRTVSGLFIMIPPDASPAAEPLFFADCAVVIDPTPDQLVDIAHSTAISYESLRVDSRPARVAFLSFSTHGSARHPSQEKIATAAKAFANKYPHWPSDGEVQVDAALVASVAERKIPGSLLGGKANCLIFPNLDAGNIAYKVAERLAGYQAVGPILQGLARPYCDLSRGCSTHDIVLATCVSALRAASS